MKFAVPETILIDVLIIGCPVEFQARRGLINQSNLRTSLVRLVVFLVEVLVVDKTFQTAVKSGNCKRQFFARTMVMRHLDIRVKPRSDAQLHVGSLIVHRVFRIDAHQSALGVLTVERALRTAQNIDTVEHIKMVVERRLRHQRNVVVIDAYSGIVDARTDASHIHRRGQTRTVLRHYKRRYELRQLAQIAHVQLLNLLTAEHAAAQRLKAQSNLLFRLRNHDHFVQVEHTRRVVLFNFGHRRHENGLNQAQKDDFFHFFKFSFFHFSSFLAPRNSKLKRFGCKGTHSAHHTKSSFIWIFCRDFDIF